MVIPFTRRYKTIRSQDRVVEAWEFQLRCDSVFQVIYPLWGHLWPCSLFSCVLVDTGDVFLQEYLKMPVPYVLDNSWAFLFVLLKVFRSLISTFRSQFGGRIHWSNNRCNVRCERYNVGWVLTSCFNVQATRRSVVVITDNDDYWCQTPVSIVQAWYYFAHQNDPWPIVLLVSSVPSCSFTNNFITSC